MKKKNILVILGIVFVIIIVVCSYFLIFEKKSEKFQKEDFIIPALKEVHADIILNFSKKETISMALNHAKKSTQYENQLGTFAFLYYGNQMQFVKLLEGGKIKYVDVECENIDSCDVSRLYDLTASFINHKEFEDKNKINYTLTHLEKIELLNLLILVSANPIEDNNNDIICYYEIENKKIKELNCSQNGNYVIQIKFSQFDALDKSNLVKIYTEK